MRTNHLHRRLALIGLTAIAATLFVVLVPPSAASAARQCVTKAEFRRVMIDNTQTRVERVFGARGTQVADLSITRGEVADESGSEQVWTHFDIVKAYPKCSAWGTGRTVLVGFEQWQPTEPFRVWMKAPRSTHPVLTEQTTAASTAASTEQSSERPEWTAPTPDPVLVPPTTGTTD